MEVNHRAEGEFKEIIIPNVYLNIRKRKFNNYKYIGTYIMKRSDTVQYQRYYTTMRLTESQLSMRLAKEK
jgi:hypothetical protein